MSELLFVNACVRGARSRTLALARHFLSAYTKNHPEVTVTERNLMTDRLEPQYPEVLDRRDALWSAGQLDDPSFDAAWQFARADKIVIAAPFWDLSYPAILKIYLERISVCDITFGYDAAGNSIGLSRAGKQLLITTRGGNFSLPETAWMESGPGTSRPCAPCTASRSSGCCAPRVWTMSAATRRPFWPGP